MNAVANQDDAVAEVSEVIPTPSVNFRSEGVRCPLCSCGDIPVQFTRHYGTRTKQTRECRNCKKRFGTWLTVIAEGSTQVALR